MIIVVSELYYPEEVSTGYILTKIAEGLAAKNHVEVVTGPPDYSGTQNVPLEETHKNIKIHRIRIKSYDKNKLLTRLIRSIVLSFKLVIKTFQVANKGDVVFLVTNPAPLLVVVSLFCKIFRLKLIVLVHDVFPENLHAANIIRNDSSVFRLLKYIFDTIYNLADQIVVIGRDMQEIIKKKASISDSKIKLITNWADVNEVYPTLRSQNMIIQQNNLEDKFIVQFAGNLGRVQGVEYILEAAELLAGTNIHFLLIGDGARKEWLIEQVKIRKLKNLTFISNMPRNRQIDFLNACDIALVTLAKDMKGLGVPSKSYNIMAAGKPIIAMVDEGSEIALMIEEESIGWVVNPGDSQALASKLLEIRGLASLNEIGRRARTVAEQKYSLDRILNKFDSLINESIK